MSKNIKTLIPDIYKVIEGNGGWDETITKFLADEVSKVAEERFSKPQEPRNYLSLSSMGHCPRKLWYKVNQSETAIPLTAEALGTFFYGDLIEALVISLAMAAGHNVEACQEEVEVEGIKGHIDCIIDGVLVDVKSASSYGFKKFKDNGLRKNDDFGYLSQLSSYLYALQDDPRLKQRRKAAFLAVRKDRFSLHLDWYDFRKELSTKAEEIDSIKRKVQASNVGMAGDRKRTVKKPNGNEELCVVCGYCEFRDVCWPEIRTFVYSKDTDPKYVHLTNVVKEPRVNEV